MPTFIYTSNPDGNLPKIERKRSLKFLKMRKQRILEELDLQMTLWFSNYHTIQLKERFKMKLERPFSVDDYMQVLRELEGISEDVVYVSEKVKITFFYYN